MEIVGTARPAWNGGGRGLRAGEGARPTARPGFVPGLHLWAALMGCTCGTHCLHLWSAFYGVHCDPVALWKPSWIREVQISQLRVDRDRCFASADTRFHQPDRSAADLEKGDPVPVRRPRGCKLPCAVINQKVSKADAIALALKAGWMAADDRNWFHAESPFYWTDWREDRFPAKLSAFRMKRARPVRRCELAARLR